MTSVLYFVRHGLTDWNAEHRLQGQADIAVNAIGQQQIRRNAEKLASLISDPLSFDYVASPLLRTRMTMARIREEMKLPSLDFRTDSRLLEVHFGDWQGFTYAELEVKDPGSTHRREQNKWWFVPPGDQAENYEILKTRVANWFETVHEPTVCVTHGGVLRTLVHLLTELPIEKAVNLEIPQDRILRVEGTAIDWI